MATVVFADFEWDAAKAESNLRKHGVSFEEAITALADPRALDAPDLLDERRHVTIGRSRLLEVLFVVHTETDASSRTRVISARRASARQRRLYEEG